MSGGGEPIGDEPARCLPALGAVAGPPAPGAVAGGDVVTAEGPTPVGRTDVTAAARVEEGFAGASEHPAIRTAGSARNTRTIRLVTTAGDLRKVLLWSLPRGVVRTTELGTPVDVGGAEPGAFACLDAVHLAFYVLGGCGGPVGLATVMGRTEFPSDDATELPTPR